MSVAFTAQPVTGETCPGNLVERNGSENALPHTLPLNGLDDDA